MVISTKNDLVGDLLNIPSKYFTDYNVYMYIPHVHISFYVHKKLYTYL